MNKLAQRCAIMLCTMFASGSAQAFLDSTCFNDVVNEEQKFNLEPVDSRNVATSGTYKIWNYTTNPLWGGVTLVGTNATIWRAGVRGRPAILVEFFGGFFDQSMLLSGLNFMVVQNGIYYRGVNFNNGKSLASGGHDLRFFFAFPPTSFGPLILEQCNRTIKFDPLKAFDFYFFTLDFRGNLDTIGQKIMSVPDFYYPLPTVSVRYSPDPVDIGQTYTLTTSTTGATELSFSCSGAYNGSGKLPIGQNQVATALAYSSYAGKTVCSFTATGVGGSSTTSASITVRAPVLAPTVSATYSPNPVVAGSYYTLTTSTANADSLTFSCSGAYNGSGSLPTGHNVQSTALAYAAYMGNTTCTFTAVGPGGMAQSQASIMVSPPPPAAPTVSAYYWPNPVRTGQVYSLYTSTTDATSLTFACSGAFTGSGSLTPGLNQVASATAPPQFVGLTTCAFTASGPGGQATTYASLSQSP